VVYFITYVMKDSDIRQLFAMVTRNYVMAIINSTPTNLYVYIITIRMCVLSNGGRSFVYLLLQHFCYLRCIIQMLTLSFSKSFPRHATSTHRRMHSPRFDHEWFTFHLLTCWFLLKLFLRPWRWKRYVPPKHWLQLNRLHGVISQKMILFITSAVKTSDPTFPKNFVPQYVYYLETKMGPPLARCPAFLVPD
jgi:hypothetical protein